MNRFFDGAFLTFGIDVLRFLESDQEDRIDPMIYVFPRMTKCTFYKYGVSGEVERHDAVCILPLNVVNEKIYVFLWFWFLFLGVLSLLTVIYRVSAAKLCVYTRIRDCIFTSLARGSFYRHPYYGVWLAPIDLSMSFRRGSER